MNQPEHLSAHKFSLFPGSITRLFLLLLVLILVAMGVIVQSSVNIWLKEKSHQITDIAQELHKRIEMYRYVTWQIYDNVAVTTNQPDNNLQETRLRPDIYALEKPRHKTEALIYGAHDSGSLEMSDRISDYLDILWGAEQIAWSMYYLNGQDNSLILVSTLPLKERATSFKEPDIRSLIDARRTEMLQQANALDVRESFSGLRFLNWQNGYYFTLRTTFNQPGHLATVVAFDLPINDLVPPTMPLNTFRINSDPLAPARLHDNTPQQADSVHISFTGSHIEMTSPIASTRMALVWQISLTALLIDTLQNALLPLLINIGLLVLALVGYTNYRYPQASQQRPDNTSALHILRALNEEIIARLPVGLLVYDNEASRTLFSNQIADNLLPHLDLTNISEIAGQHQGIIQVTINNELYEIRLFHSQVTPNTQIFILRDQDKEMLVNSKLKQARQLYEQNQRDRSDFIRHLSHALKQPVARLSWQADTLPAPLRQPLQEQAQAIIALVEEIQLFTRLENADWQKRDETFVIQNLLDDLVVEILPLSQRKGLQLLVDNPLPPGDTRKGDPYALRVLLTMLLRYAITTTQIGRISLNITCPPEATDQIIFSLLDTGSGLKQPERDNLNSPYLNPTSGDDYGDASGLTFYLCSRLAAQFNGQFTLQSQPGLGSHYQLSLTIPRQSASETEQEKLLDGMVAMVDISAGIIRELVMRRLCQWGARCIAPDEKFTRQAYDIFFTDNPSNLTASGILLSDDECGVQHYGAGKWRVNFNITRDLQEAVLQLIEEQLILEDTSASLKDADEIATLDASGYYPLFAETVPADVQKLHADAITGDHTAMAQTAHRLKGVFAMLNLIPGKQLCETLEHHIRQKDAPAIEKDTSEIDAYVNRLLSQGSLHE